MENIAFKVKFKTFRRYELRSGFYRFHYEWFNSEKIVFSCGVKDSYGIEIILTYNK